MSSKNNPKNIDINNINLKNVDGVISTEKYTIIGWNSNDNNGKEIDLEGVEFFLIKEKKNVNNNKNK
jgi:hypothetical protein